MHASSLEEQMSEVLRMEVQRASIIDKDVKDTFNIVDVPMD